jgi:hypothetical protein
MKTDDQPGGDHPKNINRGSVLHRMQFHKIVWSTKPSPEPLSSKLTRRSRAASLFHDPK